MKQLGKYESIYIYVCVRPTTGHEHVFAAFCRLTVQKPTIRRTGLECQNARIFSMFSLGFDDFRADVRCARSHEQYILLQLIDL